MEYNYTELNNLNVTSTNDINFDLIILAFSSIISFIVGWSLSIITEQRRKKQLISQSVKMMISEVEKIKKAIDEKKKPSIVIDEEKPSSFKINLSFGGYFTSSYESMMISGALKEIELHTQEKIIDLYEHIRLYNDLKIRLQEIVMISHDVKPQFVENLGKFGETLDNTVKSIKTKIDELLPILQKL